MRILFILCLLLTANFTQAQTDFSPERLEEFRKLTEQRVADFQEYLSIVTDKKRPMEERKEAIELAVGLFIEGAKMQVSGKNKTTQRVPIRGYFNKLLGLAQYHEIKITYYDVATVSKFEKGADGDYHATATYFQKFEGFDASGKALYADRTRKDIAVNGKAGNKDRDKNDLKIFFGDVTVRETIPITSN